MSKYIIRWTVDGTEESEIVEAENEQAAIDMAFEAWCDHSDAIYSAEPIEETQKLKEKAGKENG